MKWWIAGAACVAVSGLLLAGKADMKRFWEMRRM
jgi:hypothetical protein